MTFNSCSNKAAGCRSGQKALIGNPIELRLNELIPWSLDHQLDHMSFKQGGSRMLRSQCWLQFSLIYGAICSFVQTRSWQGSFVIFLFELQRYIYLSLIRMAWPPNFSIVISFSIRNTLGRVFFSFLANSQIFLGFCYQL